MGMPLYGLRDYKEDKGSEELEEEKGRRASVDRAVLGRPLGRARSRSSSRIRLAGTSKNSLYIP